jgi:large repetitive protein
MLDSKGRPVEGWDGTFNGVLMPQGVYMWKISATFSDSKEWEGSDNGKGKGTTLGTVTLIR